MITSAGLASGVFELCQLCSSCKQRIPARAVSTMSIRAMSLTAEGMLPCGGEGSDPKDLGCFGGRGAQRKVCTSMPLFSMRYFMLVSSPMKATHTVASANVYVSFRRPIQELEDGTLLTPIPPPCRRWTPAVFTCTKHAEKMCALVPLAKLGKPPRHLRTAQSACSHAVECSMTATTTPAAYTRKPANGPGRP
jgi:hypothetical protein